MKTVTTDKVKRLPPGTKVYLVNDETGQRGSLMIVKAYNKKVLQGAMNTLKIIDRAGWHYEIEG